MASTGPIRQAVRAVILDGRDILLLYTARFDDYTLPGGGVHEGEERLACLAREVAEETGARGLEVLAYLGEVEEVRPHTVGKTELIRMHSHIYLCRSARALGPPRPEHYEISNGMEARWVDIDAALAHNQALLDARPPGMGHSVERETRLLRHVRDTLLA